MKKIVTILFVVLGAFSNYSNACRFNAQTIEERFKNASYAISELSNKEYYQESLAKIKKLSNSQPSVNQQGLL